jgi:hypothetical protein
MENDFEELEIEPRGTGYVLSRTDFDGTKTELMLSELNVVVLARLVPPIVRRINASKSLAPGIGALVAAPVQDFELNTDLHGDLILLRLRDDWGGDFDFSFEPAGARILADRLNVWAAKAESLKPTRQ